MDIPFDPRPTVAPAGASGVFLNVNPNPNAFGASVAEGIKSVGASLGTAGDQTAQTAMMFQKEYNESATDQANSSYEAKARDLLFGQNGFYTKKGQDAMDAMVPTSQDLEGARQDVRAQLNNPEQQRMYDYMTRRSASRELYQMQAHATTEFRVWQGDTAKGAIENEVNNSATYWNDDQKFAQSIGNIRIQAAKLLQLKGIDPESDTGKAEITHYTSEAWSARVRSVMAQDAGVAREMFDANADQIDAGHRAVLDQQITSHQYMQIARQESQQRSADAQAERQLRSTQAANLAQFTGDVLGGKPVDWGKMADLVRTQQVAPHVPEFLMSLQSRRGAGAETDRADTVIALHKMLNDPTVSVDDRMAAISGAARGRAITATTAGTLVDAAFKRDQKGDNQTARESRASVLAAAGVPDGLINIGHEDAARKAQVEVEWTNRVTNGGEDPIAVRDDMIPRYMPSGIPPSTWPIPKYGPITSSDDAAKVATATKAAFDAGQITAAKYQSEKANIVNYGSFFQRLDASRAAAASVKSQQSPSGNKAKLKGVVPAESGS